MAYYVAVVKNELKFVESLKETVSKFEVFFPHVMKLEKRRFWKKAKEVLVPTFPGYVFIKVCSDELHKVRKADSYIKMLRKVGSLAYAEVTDEQIECLKNTKFEISQKTHESFKVGDRVEFCSSVLVGCLAIVVEGLHKSPYIKVLIEGSENEMLVPRTSIRTAA